MGKGGEGGEGASTLEEMTNFRKLAMAGVTWEGVKIYDRQSGTDKVWDAEKLGV